MSVSVGDRELPVGAGAALGAGAWLLGYLFTYVVASGRIQDSPVRRLFETFGADVPTWKVVGWVFFNAHTVDTVSEGLFGGASNFVGGDGFTALLYLVPPLLLVAAGLAAGRAAGIEDAVGGAFAGATVALGYLLLSAVGVFLFPVGGESAVGPAVGAGLAIAGVFYPLVFGTLGGVAAGVTTDSTGADATPQL